MPNQPETSYSRVAGQPPSSDPSRGTRRGSEPLPYDSGDARDQRSSRERGLPGWAAVLLLIAIAGVGGLIDSISGTVIKGAFNYGLVFASLVAILAVKRSKMFGVIVAPPLVYFVASASLLYVRTGGLHNRGKLYDAATNWVVYGFPAIAGATAVVLVIAGIRLAVRR